MENTQSVEFLLGLTGWAEGILLLEEPVDRILSQTVWIQTQFFPNMLLLKSTFLPFPFDSPPMPNQDGCRITMHPRPNH